MEAVMEPELEEAVDTPDTPFEGDDEEDQPGWLINYTSGGHPIVVRLEGTQDESLSKDDVFARFDETDAEGKTFFRLGKYRGRMSEIRDLSWSEDVELPELMVIDSVQGRIDDMLDGLEEIATGVAQIAQGAAVDQFMHQQVQAQAGHRPLKVGKGKSGKSGKKNKGKLPPGM